MEVSIERFMDLFVLYGIKVIAALVIFVIGRWVAKLVHRIVDKVMKKREVDGTVSAFVGNFTYYTLLAFFIVAALGQLGIQTTSFIAVIGAAGLAVGLALQGSLSNFAAGFLLLIFRPFRVGEYIEGGGTAGTVEKIQLFTTQLKTPDNKTVIVPNSGMTGGNIVNYSTKGTRRVDMVFGISYSDDIDQARTIIEEIISSDERVLKDPAPVVALSALADSSVDFVARPWVESANYFAVLWDITEKVKKRFDEAGVSIPFPQRDVHLYEHKA
ncbi:MAG: mechanosensitive ion channel family protein [Thermodesulfobacteriota bacterium]